MSEVTGGDRHVELLVGGVMMALSLRSWLMICMVTNWNASWTKRRIITHWWHSYWRNHVWRYMSIFLEVSHLLDMLSIHLCHHFVTHVWVLFAALFALIIFWILIFTVFLRLVCLILTALF